MYCAGENTRWQKKPPRTHVQWQVFTNAGPDQPAQWTVFILYSSTGSLPAQESCLVASFLTDIHCQGVSAVVVQLLTVARGNCYNIVPNQTFCIYWKTQILVQAEVTSHHDSWRFFLTGLFVWSGFSARRRISTVTTGVKKTQKTSKACDCCLNLLFRW